MRGFHTALHELRNAEPVEFQVQAVGIHLGEFEQVVGETRETPRMLEDDLEEADAILRVFNRAGEQSFGETLNRGERRLEFVRYIGDEIAADAFEFAQIFAFIKANVGNYLLAFVVFLVVRLIVPFGFILLCVREPIVPSTCVTVASARESSA